MITITKTITQPEEVINQFADDLGYQSVVVDGEAQVNTETGEITTPTIPNPQTRVQFVSEKFDEFVSEQFFGQFAKRNAERIKAEEAKELTKQTVEAIKATIATK